MAAGKYRSPEVEESESEEEEEDLDFGGVTGNSGNSKGKKSNDDEDVTMDLSFTDPKEIHFLSVRRLLRGWGLFGLGHTWDVDDMTRMVLHQRSVGTMVSVNDDVDAYGMATALNLRSHAKRGWVEHMRRVALSKCEEEHRGELESALNGSCALVVSERIINLPLHVAPPLWQSLLEDVEWAQENEDTEEFRAMFRFDKALLFLPCFVLEEEDSTKKSSSRKRARVADMGYYHFEDEAIAAASTILGDIPESAPAPDMVMPEHGPKRIRRMCLLPWSTLQSVVRTFASKLLEIQDISMPDIVPVMPPTDEPPSDDDTGASTAPKIVMPKPRAGAKRPFKQ